MKRKYIWQKAFSLSFAFHLIVIFTVGTMLVNFHKEIQRPQEQLITVNLADTPEEIAKAQEQASPFNKLKNLLNSPATNDEAKSTDTKNEPKTENSSQESPSNTNTDSAAGEMSSPDGILPASTGNGNSSNTDSSANAAGNSTSNGGQSNSGGDSESGSNGNDSGGGVDNESAQNVANRFSATVNNNKNYPYAAKRLNQQGSVGLHVVIDTSGNLISASVTAPVNGNLDKAALNAVYASCPFPHNHGSTVAMDINVKFYLN